VIEAEVRRTWDILHHDRVAAYAGAPYMLHYFGSRPDQTARMGDFALGPDELVKAAAAAEAQGMNFYVQLNPSLRRDSVRSRAEDITHWSYHLLDIDPGPKGEPFMALEEFLRFYHHRWGLKLTPHVIFSGRGVQAWIPFKVPVPTSMEVTLVKTVDREKVPVVVKIGAIANRVQSYWLRLAADRVGNTFDCVLDPAVADLPRVMRCPGTVNVKSGKVAEWVREGSPMGWLAEKLVNYAPAEQVIPPPPPEVMAGRHWQFYVPRVNWAGHRYLTYGGEMGQRHDMAVKAAKSLYEVGCEEEQARAALAWGNKLSSPEPLGQEEMDQILRSVYKRVVV
jgi:hypothetical protein